MYQSLPNYLTSYDAIVPLMQKLAKADKGEPCMELLMDILFKHLDRNYPTDEWNSYFDATPSQLCEALLRATNKWIEE